MVKIELFATFVITPSGTTLYSDVRVNLERSKSLIIKGIEELISKSVNHGDFKNATDMRSKTDNLIYMNYQNFGDITIVIIVDENVELRRFIRSIGWNYLRIHGEDLSINLTHEKESKFDAIYQKLFQDSVYRIRNERKSQSNISSVTLLTIPLKYRSLALLLLDNKDQPLSILAERLGLDVEEVGEQMSYLREQGYI